MKTVNLEVCKNNTTILNNINVKFQKHTLTSILGPNGAGKTTFLKSLAGLEEKSLHTIELNGTSLKSLSLLERSRKIAWVPTSLQIPFQYTVYELLLMARFPWHQGNPNDADIQFVETIIDQLNLGAIKFLPYNFLSTGQQKLTLIARAFAQDTEFVILDEPSAHLDLSISLKIMNLFKTFVKMGKTIIISLHDISLAKKFSDHAIMLKEGKIVKSGNPSEIFIPEIFRGVFGVKINFYQYEGSESISIDL